MSNYVKEALSAFDIEAESLIATKRALDEKEFEELMNDVRRNRGEIVDEPQNNEETQSLEENNGEENNG